MWIGVDAADSCLFAALATPPVAITDKEELLLREIVQTRKILVRGLCTTLLPGGERGRDTARIGNVLA